MRGASALNGAAAAARLSALQVDASARLAVALQRAATADDEPRGREGPRSADDDGDVVNPLRRSLAKLELFIEGTAAEGLDPASLAAHRSELADLRRRANRAMDTLRDSQRQGGGPLSIAAARTQLGLGSAPRAADTAPTSQRAAGSAVERAAESTAIASLRRTRAMLLSEVDRVAGVNGLLASDAASLERTAAEQAGLGGDAAEARERVLLFKSREATDRRAMLAAFAVLAVSAAYIVARRVCALFGIRLP